MPRTRRTRSQSVDGSPDDAPMSSAGFSHEDVTALIATLQRSQLDAFRELLHSVRQPTPPASDLRPTGNFSRCKAVFSGRTDESVEGFIDAIESFKEAANVPDDVAVKGFSMLLTHTAATWWQGVKHQVPAWNDVISNLRSAFGDRRPPHRIYVDLFAESQQSEEKTDLFVARVRALFAQLPRGDLTEKVELDMTYGLLSNHIRKRLRREEFSDFNSLLHQARSIEDSSRESRAETPASAVPRAPLMSPPPPAASTRLATAPSLRPDVNIPTVTGPRIPTPSTPISKRCVYCKSYGHNRDQCRKLLSKQDIRNDDNNSVLSCYGCGEKGVIRSAQRSRSGSMQMRGNRRDRSRSRSVHSNSSQGSENVEETTTIHIRNLPAHWTFEKVRTFIRERERNLANAIKFVKVVKDNNRKSTGESLVKFTNNLWAHKALNALNGINCEDRTLIVEFSNESIMPNSSQSDRRPKQQNNQQRNWLTQSESPKRKQSQVEMSTEKMETYGLNVSFLNGLGIKLPLLNKLFIANLDPRVDEVKLKEVFSYAGKVNNLFLLKKDDGKRMAKVEYDHPVEAVQAISMLNNQELYGKKMVVHMDNSPGAYPKRLPEGLKGFGPGLGSKGEPMKGVRTVVELQLIKAMLLQELQKQKPAENQTSQANQVQMDNIVNPAFNVQNALAPFNLMGNIFPLKNNPLFDLQSILNPTAQALQAQQSLLQPDLATTLATLQSQNIAQNLSNIPVFTQNAAPSQSEWTVQSQQNQAQSQMLTQNSYGNRQQTDSDYNGGRSQYSSDARKSYSNSNFDNSRHGDSADNDVVEKSTSDMVVFSNLPSSVTLEALTSKMREVGDVKFAETTGKGRAIVRFFNVLDAERCIKLFNRSKVDGQSIDVMFF